MNYNNKIFRLISSSKNSEVTEETFFEYKQTGNVLSCDYKGGSILYGHLVGLVDDNGKIDMRYHQVNLKGEIMTGICNSKPELLDNGKVRLHESWQWTSGDKSKGESVLEEI